MHKNFVTEQRFIDLYTSLEVEMHPDWGHLHSDVDAWETSLELMLQRYRVLSYWTPDYEYGLEAVHLRQFVKLHPGRRYACGIFSGPRAKMLPKYHDAESFHEHMAKHSNSIRCEGIACVGDPAGIIYEFLVRQAEVKNSSKNRTSGTYNAVVAFGLDLADLGSEVSQDLIDQCDPNSWSHLRWLKIRN